MDLPGLYRRFIQSKYDIYYTEKSKTTTGKTNAEELRECNLKCIQLEHELLALEALFTEDQVTFVQSYNHSTFSGEELARIGIVQRNNEGKPQFIHRIFAEYFVAEFLIKQLTKKTKQYEQVQELLVNVVFSKEYCKVIRAFLDGLLENSKPTKEVLREYGEKLEHWYKRNVHAPLLVHTTALHVAEKENNARITRFLIDSLKSRECLLDVTKSLLAKDHQGKTAWHKAAEGGSIEVLEKLWDLAKELRLKPEELRNEVLLSKDKQKETAWHKAAKKAMLKYYRNCGIGLKNCR